MTNQLREAFEKEFFGKVSLEKDSFDHDYMYQNTHWAHRGWQASAAYYAKQVSELPDSEYSRGFDDGQNKTNTFRLRLVEADKQIAEMVSKKSFYREKDRADLAEKIIEELKKQIAKSQKGVVHWKANHDSMVEKCAFLSQRPDLPVDRIPAYGKIAGLQEQVRVCRHALLNCINILDMDHADFEGTKLAWEALEATEPTKGEYLMDKQCTGDALPVADWLDEAADCLSVWSKSGTVELIRDRAAQVRKFSSSIKGE
jgi:hypothetical protein